MNAMAEQRRPKDATTRVTITIEASSLAWYEELADREGSSVAHQIRRALREHATAARAEAAKGSRT